MEMGAMLTCKRELNKINTLYNIQTSPQPLKKNISYLTLFAERLSLYYFVFPNNSIIFVSY